MSLPTPRPADGQTLQQGSVAQKADAAAGHWLATHFSEDMDGCVIVLIHFVTAGYALFLHEDDGPDHEDPDQFGGSCDAYEHWCTRMAPGWTRRLAYFAGSAGDAGAGAVAFC